MVAVELIPITGVGKLISMTEYRGKVFVAFEGGLFRLEGNADSATLVRVEFNREQT